MVMQGRSDPDQQLLDASAMCRHLVADDSVCAFLADHRHQLFPDEMFADLFPSGRGRPSVPAECDRHGHGPPVLGRSFGS